MSVAHFFETTRYRVSIECNKTDPAMIIKFKMTNVFDKSWGHAPYTSFSYGHTKTSHRNQNNSVKYQNPDETGIREYSNRIRLNHRRGSRTARIRPPPPGGHRQTSSPPPAAGCPPVEGPTGDSCQAAKCPPASVTSGQEASIPRESRTGARADPDGR